MSLLFLLWTKRRTVSCEKALEWMAQCPAHFCSLFVNFYSSRWSHLSVWGDVTGCFTVTQALILSAGTCLRSLLLLGSEMSHSDPLLTVPYRKIESPHPSTLEPALAQTWCFSYKYKMTVFPCLHLPSFLPFFPCASVWIKWKRQHRLQMKGKCGVKWQVRFSWHKWDRLSYDNQPGDTFSDRWEGKWHTAEV